VKPDLAVIKSIVWSSSSFKSTMPLLPNAPTAFPSWHERDEPVARRDVQDPRIAGRRSSSESAARTICAARFAALAFVLAVRPQDFAGCSIERHDRAARADVAYIMPPTMSGVPSKLTSGRGPKASVLKRQAI